MPAFQCFAAGTAAAAAIASPAGATSREYAGPVYVSAQTRCIDRGGEIGDSAAYQRRVHGS